MQIIKQPTLQKTRKKLSHIISSINLKSSDLQQLYYKNTPIKNPKQLKSQFVKYNLSQYFRNLEQYFQPSMIISEKKYAELPRGLYILISGKICYTWTSKQHDVDKKYQLFNASKLGIFTLFNMNNNNHIHTNINNTHQNPYNNTQTQQNQKQPPIIQPQCYSLLIQQPYSIIQCQFQNCLILQDSILIKIQEQVKQYTKFNELQKKRYDLIENCHINKDRYVSNKLFNVNIKLHSTFKRYKYIFHNTININSIAIIQSGIIKPIKNTTKNTNNTNNLNKFKYNYYLQLQKYAVLLPGINYQVISSQAQIMVIQNNLTLTYIHDDLILAYRLMKQKKQKQKLGNPSLLGSASASISTPIYYIHSHSIKNRSKGINTMHVRKKSKKQITKDMKKWEINKRKKQLTDISKKCNNQLIISMQTCKQSLSFSEQLTKTMKKFNSNKNQKPNILFDFNRYSCKKSIRSINTSFSVNRFRQNKMQNNQIQRKTRQERRTHNQKLFNRYCNISKELFDKFKQSRNAQTYTSTPVRQKENYVGFHTQSIWTQQFNDF